MNRIDDDMSGNACKLIRAIIKEHMSFLSDVQSEKDRGQVLSKQLAVNVETAIWKFARLSDVEEAQCRRHRF